MHETMEKQFAILKLYLPMRKEILDSLEDKDLAFSAKGLPSIGETCLQLGEWQHAYLMGFKTFKQDFDYRNTDQDMQSKVRKLRSWYLEMDLAIEQAIKGMSDDDIENKSIDRGTWEASVEWNLRIWQECLIIFFTKMMVNFKLMDRDLPNGLAQWIA